MSDANTVNGRDTSSGGFSYRAWWGLLGCALLMALIVISGPYSDDVVLAPDQGVFWYYWQLQEPTFWTRLSAWLPYCLHQIAIWFLINYIVGK